MTIVQNISFQSSLYLLEDTLKKFQGSTRVKEELSTSLFAEVLTKLTREYVGKQWRTLSYLWDKYETGLKYAREGNLSSAEYIFSEAAHLRNQFDQTPKLNKLVDIAALPAIAYLRYRQGFYKEAEHLLIASINSDADLLAEGFYILDYHRIQQVHNLARMYFRQEYLQEGARMIAMGLQYMAYGNTPIIGSGNAWLMEDPQCIPAQLRSAMLLQFTNETIGLYLTIPLTNRELCKISFKNLASWETRTDDEALLLQWFLLKEQYSDGQFDKFIEDSIPFLTLSSVQFDQYKLSILIDIVEGISRYNKYTLAIHKVINEFINKLNVGRKQRDTCSLFLHKLAENNTETSLAAVI